MIALDEYRAWWDRRGQSQVPCVACPRAEKGMARGLVNYHKLSLGEAEDGVLPNTRG
jgi:hypothetical protein